MVETTIDEIIIGQKRRSQRSPKSSPTERGYWTTERLDWLEDKVTKNNALYDDYTLNDGSGAYRSSTAELVRYLKGLPEWAGLSAAQAHEAIVVGLYKLRQDSDDVWELLSENYDGTSAEEDFLAGWRGLRIGKLDAADYLQQAVEQAKNRPIGYNEDDEQVTRLQPLTKGFKLFCDVCLYLQTMVGPGYILLPQSKLAELLDVSQQMISAYCRRAEDAGFLVKLDPRYSAVGHRAIRWHCTSTWSK